MDSYDVRFWDTRKIADNASGGRYRVRWAVNGQEHCKSFKNKTLADGFLDNLKDAARDRRPFSPRTGLPATETTEGETVTWYEHARSYAEAKWPNLAPVSRRSVAEALVTVTIALTAKEKGAPEARVLRRALFAWAFNPATRQADPPREIALALGWAARASLPVAALDDPATVRVALGACAKTLTGKSAAGSTQRRKRSVFYNALGYAVELGRLASNPIDRIQWTAPAVAQTVDRRVVVSPAQASKLLAAVRGLSDRGAHLEAFYGCLYYAALRPSEAVMLRELDLYLPGQGVGEDRPGRLRLPGGDGLDRPRHLPPGTRPQAPRRQRDAHHPHPARTRQAAPRPHQEVRHHPRRTDLPDHPGRHHPGLRLQRRVGRGPQDGAHRGAVPLPARPPPL